MCFIAALTAPQPLWPNTMISGTLSSATAYSILPLTVTPVPLTTLPAIRTTKMSPIPISNRISAATRESAQLTMTASGYWASARARKSSGPGRGLAGCPFHETSIALDKQTQCLVRADGCPGLSRRFFLRKCKQPLGTARLSPAAAKVTNSRRENLDRFFMIHLSC